MVFRPAWTVALTLAALAMSVTAAPLQVIDIQPPPGSTLVRSSGWPPASSEYITVTFNQPIDPESIQRQLTWDVYCSGQDGVFGDRRDYDDYPLLMTAVEPDTLTIFAYEKDTLQLTLRGDPRESTGQLDYFGGRWCESQMDATVMALEISGELVAPQALVDEIDADLKAIRAASPELHHIFHMPLWEAGELIIYLREEAAEQCAQGTYTGLDDLNASLGVIQASVDLRGSLPDVWLRFREPYNPELLASLYASAEGVDFTEVLLMGSDGNDIQRIAPHVYELMAGWGDCMAGCLYHHYWLFSVEDGIAHLESEYGDPLGVGEMWPGMVPLDWPLTITALDGTPLDGEFDGTFPSGDGVPGGDFVVVYNPMVAGDPNFDGDQDVADLTLLINELEDWPTIGGITPPPALDINGDGLLDESDLEALIDSVLGRP